MSIRKRIYTLLLCIAIALSTCACKLSDKDIQNIFQLINLFVDDSEAENDGEDPLISVSIASTDNGINNTSIESADNNSTETSIIPSISEEPAVSVSTGAEVSTSIEVEENEYSFRNNKLWTEHYEKHGIEMGFANKEEYAKAANKVINNPNSLHKLEKEDGDDVYFLEESGEFVVVSKDGYIRTYFIPSAGKKYFDKQ